MARKSNLVKSGYYLEIYAEDVHGEGLRGAVSDLRDKGYKGAEIQVVRRGESSPARYDVYYEPY